MSSELLECYDIKSGLVLYARGVMLQDNTLDQTDPQADSTGAAGTVSPHNSFFNVSFHSLWAFKKKQKKGI